ncbi:MAG: mCpol domain-containing protein [Cyanobacteria bacterium P01_D01_bin.156]
MINLKVTSGKMGELYLAIDGDDVGHRLEYLMLINERETIFEFSKIFQSAMNWLEIKLVEDFDADIIFNGGDNLLACLSTENLTSELMEELRTEFAKKADSTISVGLGNSPRQAYFALKLAKTSGKNCIRHFQELANG